MNSSSSTYFNKLLLSTVESSTIVSINHNNLHQIDDESLYISSNHKGIYSFYLIIAIITSIVGTIGNLMLIICILASKELRTNSTCILCLNIAFSDFLMSIFVNGFGKFGNYFKTIFALIIIIISSFNNKQIANFFYIIESNQLRTGLIVCKLLSTFCMLSCGASMITMGMLAINRYVCMFYNSLYSCCFSTNKTVLMCVFSWLIAFVLDFGNILSILVSV